MNRFPETVIAPRNHPMGAWPSGDRHYRLPSPRPVEPSVVCHLEDDPAWRVQLADTVDSLDSFTLGDLPSAVIVVLELWYRGESGFEIAARLRKGPGRVRVLALTSRCDAVAMHHAQDGLLDGFVWKIPAAGHQITEALLALEQDRTYFPKEVTDERRRLEALPDAYFKLLSPTEVELLPYFARFMKDPEIATKVGSSERTIRWHRKKIEHLIGATSFGDLCNWALCIGFAPLNLPAPPCLVI